MPRLVRLDEPTQDGRSRHDVIGDKRVRGPHEDPPSPALLDRVRPDLEFTLALTLGDAPARGAPEWLSRYFAGSIGSRRTRELLSCLRQAGGDGVALDYLFGFEDGRRLKTLAPLSAASQIWPSPSARQIARKLLDRCEPILRRNFLLLLACRNPELFGTFLRRVSSERWRSRAVDSLLACRDADGDVPDRLRLVLSERAGELAVISHSSLATLLSSRALTVHSFFSLYNHLRFVGTFARAATVRELVHHHDTTSLRGDGSTQVFVRRALERPLHLIADEDEANAFITRLLDWAEDCERSGAVFAAYTALYYLDRLDDATWNTIEQPYELESAWSTRGIQAVVEETNENIDEAWYRQPNQSVVNALRLVNYLRAHPELRLSKRCRTVCVRVARVAIECSSHISHTRVERIRFWCRWLEQRAGTAPICS